MKSLVCMSALVWLSCGVLLAQNTDNSAGQPGTGNNGSMQALPCATPNPASGYTPPIKLPKSRREIKGYNVDYPETGHHNPVCLSKSADDAILWVSGSSKKFKMKIHPEKGQDSNCGQHPFLKDPPSDLTDGVFSGSLNPNVPNYCVYDVEFQMADGPVTDPHIQTTP
jgi:hypothetical protein